MNLFQEILRAVIGLAVAHVVNRVDRLCRPMKVEGVVESAFAARIPVGSQRTYPGDGLVTVVLRGQNECLSPRLVLIVELNEIELNLIGEQLIPDEHGEFLLEKVEVGFHGAAGVDQNENGLVHDGGEQQSAAVQKPLQASKVTAQDGFASLTILVQFAWPELQMPNAAFDVYRWEHRAVTSGGRLLDVRDGDGVVTA